MRPLDRSRSKKKYDNAAPRSHIVSRGEKLWIGPKPSLPGHRYIGNAGRWWIYQVTSAASNLDHLTENVG